MMSKGTFLSCVQRSFFNQLSNLFFMWNYEFRSFDMKTSFGKVSSPPGGIKAYLIKIDQIIFKPGNCRNKNCFSSPLARCVNSVFRKQHCYLVKHGTILMPTKINCKIKQQLFYRWGQLFFVKCLICKNNSFYKIWEPCKMSLWLIFCCYLQNLYMICEQHCGSPEEPS